MSSTSGASLATRLRSARHALTRRRRLLAAATAALGALVVVGATQPPSADTVPVVVAARDLPAGTALSAEDLTTRDVAPHQAPADRPGASELLGETLAAPVAAEEQVTSARVVGTAAWQPGPGETAVPVRLPDAGVAALLSVGDTVDVVATDPQTGETSTVARSVRVAALPASDADATLGGRLVVVVAPSRDASDIAGAAVHAFLTVAFRD
ncbi:SAF domain-containing protein [Nocardioides zeae]|uniref:SAF domain-containing protein n=1 Tax=Nocardioides imazamoxiresistens TaxID=3231893 RepID=A0ABU3PWG0_9ACTN|nr:SAF domain-containing protein [Nocardioides zeae]MDT9593570.1 SAF domain-containing protein [Nocardioides zeae]